jgi:hypothetical protein
MGVPVAGSIGGIGSLGHGSEAAWWAQCPPGHRQKGREVKSEVATEQDHDKFIALVKVLNQLLDGELREPHTSTPAGTAYR